MSGPLRGSIWPRAKPDFETVWAADQATGNKEEVANEEEEQMYTHITVVTEEHMRRQVGTTTYFDLVKFDIIKVHRIKHDLPFEVFKAQIAEELGVPVESQRYWVWSRRQNGTVRPYRPLDAMEEAQTVLKESRIRFPPFSNELRLFLECPTMGKDLNPGVQSLHQRASDDILVFLKLYDPEKESLQYVGSLYVPLRSRPSDLVGCINKLAGFEENEPIEVFEEIKFDPVWCHPIDKNVTFENGELGNGDIICFQKQLPLSKYHLYRFPEVPAFMEDAVNHQIVHFRKIEEPSKPCFDLKLWKKHTYKQVISALAAQIGLEDPSKLRLTLHNVETHMPWMQPFVFKFSTSIPLHEMLQGTDILYYEVLDIPLPEFEKHVNKVLQGLLNQLLSDCFTDAFMAAAFEKAEEQMNFQGFNATSVRLARDARNAYAGPGQPLYERFLMAMMGHLAECETVLQRLEDSKGSLPSIEPFQLAFHGTMKENIPSILKEGMLPSKRRCGGDWFALESPWRSLIYCRQQPVAIDGGRHVSASMLLFLLLPVPSAVVPGHEADIVVMKNEHYELPICTVRFTYTD